MTLAPPGVLRYYSLIAGLDGAVIFSRDSMFFYPPKNE
jgi:hypothetical protein